MDEVEVDWSLLEKDGVIGVIERATRKVCYEWAPSFDYDEMLHEAYLLVATKPGKAQAAMDAGGLGVLHHWVWQQLTQLAYKLNRQQYVVLKTKDAAGVVTKTTLNHTSYDAILEATQ